MRNSSLSKKFVKESADLAANLVKGVNESHKAAAFQVVFFKLLNCKSVNKGGMMIERHKTNDIQKDHKDKSSENVDLEAGKQKLAKNCKISMESLDDIIDFRDNVVQVISPLPKLVKQAEITVAKICLAYHKIVFDKNWVDSSTVKKSIEKSGVSSAHNLSRNILEDGMSFRKRGARKNAEYKLTSGGLEHAFQTINNMASDETS